MSIPRINSFIVFDKDSCSSEIYDQYYKEQFEGKLFVFLGEIPNCPGHCIITDLNIGVIFGVCHTNNFREANEI